MGGGSLRGYGGFLVLKVEGALCPPAAPCFEDSPPRLPPPCLLTTVRTGFSREELQAFRVLKACETKGLFPGVWAVVGHWGG